MPSVGFGMGIGGGAWDIRCGIKHGSFGRKFCQRLPLAIVLLSITLQERGVGSFMLGRESSHSKFAKRMRACATLSGDDEKESLVCW